MLSNLHREIEWQTIVVSLVAKCTLDSIEYITFCSDLHKGAKTPPHYRVYNLGLHLGCFNPIQQMLLVD